MNIKQAISHLFTKNRRQFKSYEYTVPSPNRYPYQWLWDSCFHSIILTHFSIQKAKEELLSLISKQFNNGMIPHIIYWNKKIKTTFPRINWGQNNTSSITQPPMLAYAVWAIYQKDNDSSFIKKIYPNLYHFYRYLLNERDPHQNHLIGIMNPDESGEDNSPRFDIPLGLPAKQTLEENTQKRLVLVNQNIKCKFDAPFCMRNFFWVKDVPFNAILAENLRLLAQIAQTLGFQDDATYFAKAREGIFAAMRKFMLEDGLFFSTYGADYIKIKIKTWAIFAPLFAGMLTQNQADDLVKKYLLSTKQFWTKFPVPSVAIDEPSFDPQGFWRGPVWIATNWFIYKGLLKYGFADIAKQIKDSSLQLIEKSGFREQFNPFTGEGLGTKDFTWGGLIIDMDETVI